MAMNYVPLSDNIPAENIILYGEVFNRHRVHKIKFTAWDKNAVPTMSTYTLSNWCETEKGEWIHAHGVHITHLSHTDISSDETILVIYAYFTPKRWTEYCLRFLDNNT